MRYFPYGEQITRQNINNLVVDDSYTGQKKDTETDLMFYNARLYNQNTGLFMQADSVNDGLNRYMYVGGNPVTGTDPTGNQMCVSGVCITASNADAPTISASSVAGGTTLNNMSDYCASNHCQADPKAFQNTMLTVSAVAFIPVGAYLGITYAPIALSYFAQAQQLAGSPRAQTLNAGVQGADAVFGASCATGSQIGCAGSAVTGPLSFAGDVAGSVGVVKSQTVIDPALDDMAKMGVDTQVYVNKSPSGNSGLTYEQLRSIDPGDFQQITSPSGIMVGNNTLTGRSHDHTALMKFAMGDQSYNPGNGNTGMPEFVLWRNTVGKKGPEVTVLSFRKGTLPSGYVNEPFTRDQVRHAIGAIDPDFVKIQRKGNVRYVPNPYRRQQAE